jgi:flagellar biosynthesis component FlhA
MADSLQHSSPGSPGPRLRKTADANTPHMHLMSHSNIIMAVGLMAILATLIIPLPTPVLDMLLACSI